MMAPDLLALTFRVYSNIRTDIDARVDDVFDPGEDEAENTAAKAALHALAADVRAKRPDDGLRRTRAVLAGL